MRPKRVRLLPLLPLGGGWVRLAVLRRHEPTRLRDHTHAHNLARLSAPLSALLALDADPNVAQSPRLPDSSSRAWCVDGELDDVAARELPDVSVSNAGSSVSRQELREFVRVTRRRVNHSGDKLLARHRPVTLGVQQLGKRVHPLAYGHWHVHPEVPLTLLDEAGV